MHEHVELVVQGAVLKRLDSAADEPMSRRGWVLFLAMGVIWGVPYLFVKVAVESLTPASLVFLRTTVAALCSCPWRCRSYSHA